jgi:outer membrane protein TolC
MAPIDVVQAQAQAATQRQNLAVAEGTRRTTELALKRLIVSGTQDANWHATIEPADRPDFVPAPIDVEAAVGRALANRTDLAQVWKNIQVNDVTLDYLRNQTLPQVDFSARYGLIGQGGTRFVRADGISGGITDTVPGGYGNALRSLLDRNYPTWSFGVTVSYPIGTSTQEANVARARVQLNQIEAEIRQIELQVATDVTNAAIQAQNTAEAVQASQAARELSQKKLEAEQSKFEVGMSTNYFVVQAQRDLADAENSELRAILNYRKSLVELERLQSTTLQNLSITVINAGGGAPAGSTRTVGVGGQ